MSCAPLPGGYCGSFCGVTGTPCDGSCVETPRAGELCMAKCSADADCRASEGYVCDPTWKACLLPNMAVIVPQSCPAPPGVARDPAFGASKRLSTAALPGVYQLEPSSVLTDDGGLVTLYISRTTPAAPNVLGLARIDPQGVAAAIDVPFPSRRANNFDPWLARDSKGTIYATWLAFDGRADQDIALAMSRDSGVTWTEQIAVEDPVDDCQSTQPDCLDKPMVVVGPDPLRRFQEIVYVLYAGDGLRVRASRDGGKTFAPAVTALAGIYGNAVVGRDGRLHVVTLNGGPRGAFGSADHAVEYTVSSDGGATFAKPITVNIRDEMLPFFFSNPSIAVDDRRGYVYVAYTRGGRDAKWDLVIAASRDRGKTWKRTRIGDDPSCAIHMVPNLALDPTTGTLHVAWYDSRAATGRFARATCMPGGTRCTQRGHIEDQPFAALSTVRHGSKWIGEYQSLVVDARRRRLHAVWTQPVEEAGKVIARVFHAAATL